MKNNNLKNIFLEGDSIYLRPLELKDIEGNYVKWLNDEDVVKHNSHGRFPINSYRLKGYVTMTTDSNNCVVLAIIHKKQETHIGNISLQSINWVDRNAEISFILGEKSFWSKGIMFEAGKLLINHAFKKLNLHRIYCGTSSLNIGMQKLALKLGMIYEGERKEAIFKNDKYYSIIEFGILNNLNNK